MPNHGFGINECPSDHMGSSQLSDCDADWVYSHFLLSCPEYRSTLYLLQNWGVILPLGEGKELGVLSVSALEGR